MSENVQEMEDPSGSAGANSEGKNQPAGMLHLGEQQYGAAVGQQILQLAPPQQPTTLAVPGPGLQAADPQWVKYYIQRVSTNVNHVLFYVVDEAGMAKLAVVGTDVKLSGHFVYASVSDMTEAPPLRATNRQKVLEWLSALGADELAEDHEVTLPQLAPHHWAQLHSNNPMLCKPKLDRNFCSWREDVGELPDGRHYKHYYLVDAASGAERLAVTGEDSARLDRRYTYKALEDVGGFCFENGKAVSDWLDFVVGKSGLPPNFMRREKPTEKKKLRKRRAAAGASTEDEPDAPEPSGRGRVVSALPPQLPSAAPDAFHLQPPMRYGSGGVSALGQMPPPPAVGHSMYPVALQQPTHHNYLGGPSQYQQHPGGRYGASAGPLQLPGQGPPAVTEPVDLGAAVQAAGEEVRQLFAVGGQPLLEFVTHVPNQDSTDIVSEMSRRLSTFVEALGLTGRPGSSPVNAAEVVSILQFLGDRPASLKLLETTGIGRPVALLGCMHEVLAAHSKQRRADAAHELQPVYELARQLAAIWQDLAATAHKLANEALEASPGAL